MSTESASPDLVLIAKRCHRFDRANASVEALAIAGGRIVAAGTRRATLRLRSRGTRVIDLGNAVITPGLVDCHTHFFYWAINRALVIDVSTLCSLNSVLQRIHTLHRTKLVGDWVVASGFDYNRWNSGLPSAADLDHIVQDRPVLVRSRDGHTAWLNTLGLKRARITASTPDPKGGRYVRDARGRPTGIVQESAVDLLPDPVRDFALTSHPATERVIDRALQAGYRYAWAHGLVGVHSMDDGASLRHLARHQHEGKLSLRIVHAVPLAELDNACNLGLRTGFGDDWLRIGGVKVFADGALGSQTAYMFEPYPGQGDYRGVPNVAGRELEDVVRRAAERGWTTWIHAIGNRAVHESIQAIVRARRVRTTRWPARIEHAQCVRPADVRRMAQAGIIASVQPCHILGDIATADRHWPRARRDAYPFGRFLTAGVRLAAGSDAPIESLDPRRSLFGATTRTDEHNQPAGGWFPEECITTEATLRAFTQGAALTTAARNGAGTLAIGAPADLTIWQEDPLRAAPDTLRDIGIAGCVIDGRLHVSGAA